MTRAWASVASKRVLPMKALFVMDPPLALSLGQALAGEGIVIDVAFKASEADSRLRAENYAVVLVEYDRLGSSRFSRLRRWRRAGVKGHILVLLPPNCDSAERVKCLDAGADGYVLQPLCVKELQARFRAWGRRDPVLRAHDLEIDTDSRRARRGGQVIDLTPSESDIL